MTRLRLSDLLPGRLGVTTTLLTLLLLPNDSEASTNDGRPKILLHVRPVATKNACAGGVVTNCDAATTVGDIAAPGTGPFHFVYVLAAPGSGSLAGVQFGIDYQDSQPGDGFDGQGLDIFGWQKCGMLELPSGGAAPWPAPGSGNTVTWNSINACQSGSVAVAGYFYVGAYAADSLRLTVRQETGQAKVADCSGAETRVYGPDLGFALFSSTGTPGCNPCLGDCPDFGFPRPPPPPPPPPPPGTPHLDVDPESVSFTFTSASRPPATLTVSNTGEGRLEVQAASGQAWVTVTPGSHFIFGGQSADFSVSINSTGLLPGSYATTLTLTSNDSLDPAHVVPVTLTLGPPILKLQPLALEMLALVGTIRGRTEYVMNRGAIPLNWTIDGFPSWLTGNPSSGATSPGIQVPVAMTANATSLPKGDYRDTLRVHSNDPLRADEPLPVHLRVVDHLLVVEPDTVDFVLPWRGGPLSVDLLLQSLEVGVTSPFTLHPSASWLSVSPVYWSGGGSVESTFRIDASSFPVGHVETVVPVDGAGETVNVRVRVDILPTPPDIRITPATATFEAAEGSGARTGTILLRNQGYLPLTFQIAESIPWCHPLEASGTVGPGGGCVAPLVVDPTGLGAGTYSGLIEVMSNDPDQPQLWVPIRLIVRTAPAPLAPGGVFIGEVMTACAGGDTLPQFIRIVAAGGGETYRSTLGLGIEDAAGAVRYQGTGLPGSVSNGTPWPMGQSFLLASPGYQSGGVPAPDAVVPLALDPIGGVITLFDGDPIHGLLQRLPYGTRGSYSAPEPGHSLRRLPNGSYAQAAVPEPENRSGAVGSGAACPCPASRASFGDRIVQFTGTTGDSTYYGSNPSYVGNIQYDLAGGTSRVSGDHGGTGLTLLDPVTLRGLDSGTPMTFEARLHFVAAGQVNYLTFVQLASYTASLKVDAAPATISSKLIDYYGWPRFFVVDSTLTAVVSATSGRTVPIEVMIRGGGEGEGGSASVGPATLSFRGLLPGVLLESCGGFEKATPVPVELALISAEVVDGHAVLFWAGPGLIEPLFVDRRTARDEWATVGRVSPDADGRYFFEDEDVRVGETYAWRLRGSSILTEGTWLEIPGSGSPQLSLSARWDAGRRVVLVRVQWPVTGPAYLSMHDITGRLVERRELVVDAAGSADMSMVPSVGLPSGIYFLRCHQAGSTARARVVVVN